MKRDEKDGYNSVHHKAILEKVGSILCFVLEAGSSALNAFCKLLLILVQT